MTLGELGICLEGYKIRRKEREARDAYLLMNLIQPHVETSLRMLDFMPTEREEKLEEMRKLQEQGLLDPRDAVL